MICAIDPGFRGGIAILKDKKIVATYTMPILKNEKKKEIDGWKLAELLKSHSIRLVFLEKAQVMPKQGVVSSGNYMKGYGILLGVLMALRIPYEEIRPVSWKKELLKDMPKGKKSSILKVRQLFPESKIDHDGICDAILLGLYGLTKKR